jgi:hypothetical protein
MNHHNFVYSAPDNPHIFEGTLTDLMNLNMLRTSILPFIHQFYENERFYFQQDGVPRRSEATSMKPYQVNGQDEKAEFSNPTFS